MMGILIFSRTIVIPIISFAPKYIVIVSRKLSEILLLLFILITGDYLQNLW